MNPKNLPLAAAAASACLIGAGFAASALQDHGKKAPQGDDMKMEMPKPGPEHLRLAKVAGTWDAEFEMAMPGQPQTKGKGVETCKVMPGGLWVVSDYEQGDFMGTPFHGHGVTGFDTAKGKIVGTWVDSMATALHPIEGTYDEKTKTQTCFMEAPDMTGKVVKHRMVVKWTDDDTRVFQMMVPGPDGNEFQAFQITYRRRK